MCVICAKPCATHASKRAYVKCNKCGARASVEHNEIMVPHHRVPNAEQRMQLHVELDFVWRCMTCDQA